MLSLYLRLIHVEILKGNRMFVFADIQGVTKRTKPASIACGFTTRQPY